MPTASGYHKNSRINFALGQYSEKNKVTGNIMYPEIDGTYLECVLDKSDPAKFREFVAGLTYYMVIFGATALVKEGNHYDTSMQNPYILYCSLTRILSDKDIISTVAFVNRLKGLGLSGTGSIIYSLYRNVWNTDSEGQNIWNYEDCLLPYLIMQTPEERMLVKERFGQFFGVKIPDLI